MNKYAQGRMDAEFKPIDSLLMRWAMDARYDGAPRWPTVTILGKIIDQTPTGASQIGAPTETVPREIEVIDWCVAQLRDIKRKVIHIEYVTHSGRTKEQKRRKLGMSIAGWDRNLNVARECILLLYKTRF